MNVRPATADDLAWVKALADRHRADLGFITRAAFVHAMVDEELTVLDTAGGFCLWHRRRDGWTTIYDLVSEVNGGGRAMMEVIARPLRLKCPTGQAANGFYAHLGGTLVRTEPGRKRSLNVWEWS